ncbi:hypothetical protein L1987_86834 [Smallanthus sonchifolius]|uniref:Uncharacterized protein n=1 Tax=Smallanthus sonchifolius TaxID=185202 RepID=A0ACB8Y1H6_9ASTR|nr:hypothetical protein L1987_86834 [Smallanthus sonchifolius]
MILHTYDERHCFHYSESETMVIVMMSQEPTINFRVSKERALFRVGLEDGDAAVVVVVAMVVTTLDVAEMEMPHL